MSDGTIVTVESTEEAEEDESLGDVGGRSLTSSSNSSLSSKMGADGGGRCDSFALAKDFCKSLMVLMRGLVLPMLCCVSRHQLGSTCNFVCGARI